MVHPIASTQIRKVADHFDQSYFSTGAFEGGMNTFLREGEMVAKRLVEILNPPPSWTFLDVGCGLGGLVIALRNRGFQAWGTDISPYALKNNLAPAYILPGSAVALPFKNNTFSVIISLSVLYYLPPKLFMEALKEIHRVSNAYSCLEIIPKDSKNSSQQNNPDDVREEDYLLTKSSIAVAVKKVGFSLIEPLLGPEDPDFHGIFKKS